MFMLVIIYINFITTFFLPKQIKTTSGKQLILKGNGPPVLFSPGLFGSMPVFLYNNLINELKKNNTIITINDFTPIAEDSVKEICNTIKVDKIGYIGHSSFNPNVINNNKYINSALLIDPINIPFINFNSLSDNKIKTNYPITIIKANKLYYGKKTLPEWQNPNFEKIYKEIYCDGVGHPDILDDFWADIAKSIGLWEMAESKQMNYNNWTFNIKSDISQIRKKYIKYVAQQYIN